MQDIQTRATSYRKTAERLSLGYWTEGRMYAQKPAPFFQVELLGYVEVNPYKFLGNFHYSICWREAVPARLGDGRVAVTRPECMTYRWRRNA